MAQVKEVEEDPKVRSKGGKTKEIVLEPTDEEDTSPLLENTVLRLKVVGKVTRSLKPKPNLITAEFYNLDESMEES